MEQKVHDVLDVPVRVPALHELLGTPEGPLVQPAVGIYGNCEGWGGKNGLRLVRKLVGMTKSWSERQILPENC